MKKSVVVQITWAKQKEHKDLDDDAWNVLRAEVVNPNPDSFKVTLASMECDFTSDGRCENALRRWMEYQYQDVTSGHMGRQWILR